MIEFGHASHAGLRRECNEDTYWADAELGLFVVVDGMGGHGRGDKAAAIARDALVDAARVGTPIETVLRATGAAIAAFAADAPGHAPTGATLAALKIEGGIGEIARIGDARAYLWRNGSLQCLCTEPATPADADAASVDPTALAGKRNRATQALGITPPAGLTAEPILATLERGMQFLLCSDGLSEELHDSQIAATLARTDLAAQECVDHLLLAALAAGGRDDMTALLVRVA